MKKFKINKSKELMKDTDNILKIINNLVTMNHRINRHKKIEEEINTIEKDLRKK
jgi:hypothetical protein